MKDHQRLFLLKSFEGLHNDVSTDFEPDGKLGPANLRLVKGIRSTIAWLRRETTGVDPDGREFLEERLEAVDEVLGCEVVYEHDALVAAIEALR